MLISRYAKIVMLWYTSVTRLLIALISHYKLALPFSKSFANVIARSRNVPKWQFVVSQIRGAVLGAG